MHALMCCAHNRPCRHVRMASRHDAASRPPLPPHACIHAINTGVAFHHRPCPIQPGGGAGLAGMRDGLRGSTRAAPAACPACLVASHPGRAVRAAAHASATSGQGSIPSAGGEAVYGAQHAGRLRSVAVGFVSCAPVVPPLQRISFALTSVGPAPLRLSSDTGDLSRDWPTTTLREIRLDVNFNV